MNPLAILAILAVASALWTLGITANAIKTGRSQLGNWVDDRDRTPVRFWITIGFLLISSATGLIFAWELAHL